MQIRKAEYKDIQRISQLLLQVLNIHAEIRPDIFIPNTTKYSDDELKELIDDETRPIFIAADEQDEVMGYAICEIRHRAHDGNMTDILTLYIDDLCVDETYRSQHVGSSLYRYVIEYAESIGCYNVTLNVWEGNDRARAFYENMGFKIMKTEMEKILK